MQNKSERSHASTSGSKSLRRPAGLVGGHLICYSRTTKATELRKEGNPDRRPEELEKIPGGHLESECQFPNHFERWISLTAFHAAHIGPTPVF